MQDKDMNYSIFFERLIKIMQYYEIKNVKSLACDYLGYSSPQKINRLKEQGTNPSYDILVDISNKFDSLNAEWLLTGKGKMLKDSGSNPQTHIENSLLIDYLKEKDKKIEVLTGENALLKEKIKQQSARKSESRIYRTNLPDHPLVAEDKGSYKKNIKK